jgi:hypothetical protein
MRRPAQKRVFIRGGGRLLDNIDTAAARGLAHFGSPRPRLRPTGYLERRTACCGLEHSLCHQMTFAPADPTPGAAAVTEPSLAKLLQDPPVM